MLRKPKPPVDAGIVGPTVTMRAFDRKWYSSDVVVREDGEPDVVLDVAALRQRASVELDGRRWAMRREGVVRGRYTLEDENGRVVASTEPHTGLSREVVLTCEGRRLTLRRVSSWRRTMALWHGPIRSGTIRPIGFLGGRVQAALPTYLGRVQRIFLLWVAIDGWRKQTAAS